MSAEYSCAISLGIHTTAFMYRSTSHPSTHFYILSQKVPGFMESRMGVELNSCITVTISLLGHSLRAGPGRSAFAIMALM